MLDAKTGMLLWASETFTLAVLLGTLWLHRPARQHNLYFAAGFLSTGIGAILVALRGDIPNYLSIEVGNTLALSAFGFWLAGLLSFEQRKLAGWIAIPALLWVAGMLIPTVRESMVSRILLYHACAAVAYFMLAGVVLANRSRASLSRKVLAAIFILQAFFGAIIASVVIPGDVTSPGAVALTSPLAFSGILGFTVIIMISAKIIMEDSEARLHRLAMTDHLTGVLNRRGLLEEFERIKKRSPASDRYVALVLFDIDHFKKINDKYGHQSGDAVLVHFCDMARRVIGDRGLFVRMGGEEFALVAEVESPSSTVTLAEAIRSNLRLSKISSRGEGIEVTTSVGISEAMIKDADLSVMMTEADRALYAAKKAGRNRTVIHVNSANVVVPSPDRDENPMDNNADRQVAALNRISAIASR
ncbi:MULTISPECIES: GGDEF domain-containing protein [Rhizobium/Agrobacterium group]|uniref:diguanylate cyclase n=1 Tax=Agrobacterium tomkonis CFBP 6623 TaxID=1183432 RepID=A0A1S7PL46_9HYPH|nr:MULTISPECIES: GGDEF domain-containing protein [Rhizobium/Agrobacterium group]KRA63169.1 diguanylate cyclase [Rhizobium sp. Root651]QCL88521.1 GGDEF domain-containing protein [Agrobacterium tumefaciens]TKT68067.1 GGDEF domain-containing protein [Agrobacterium sp. LC34]CUX22808.1 Diguanylate cyclase [Agrobacterium tomkonis CFBP 6623]